jgi:predicted phosphoadenosine phosphosulfate sulfurtransferase
VEPAAHFRRRAQRPGVVIAFVEGYLNESWLDLKYFGVPLKSSAFVLGQIVPYTQWDPDREHVRPRPPHAIVYNDGRVFDEHSFHHHVATIYPGKIAICSGIRAAESLRRFSGSLRRPAPRLVSRRSPWRQKRSS